MPLLQQDRPKKILLGQENNTLFLLLSLNIILYIILSFISVVYLINDSTEDSFKAQVLSWFSLPAQPAVFATRPWALITYMFTHFGIWDMVSSMLWLWGFGYLLQDLTGNRKIFPLYLYGGFMGAVVFILVTNLVPALRANVNSVYPLIGSGPALMSMAIAATTLAPRYRVFPMINIPLWVFTVAFVLIRFSTIIPYPNSVGNMAATATGGLVGYLFIWQLRRGNDLGQWMSDVINWIDNLFNPDKKFVPKEQHYYKATKKPFEVTPHVTQQRVDELLDKINVKGYHSLTEEEKEFLRKASTEEL